ncbi:MAG: chromosome segregation protein SMC [Ignavibacteriales bacterium]|nr:chromosome segregation protein SMC [Ignavibacteriales bacterium]
MYLSKIEILGFKSFAQKIDLKFDAGITSIVGPNGCGKTNVVDAIRWALGEQRPTTLRSDKMEDVIFNGTKSRKPLSMAEVSLTIENTKGILPTEYSEVTITRRVYRSGEGEYYLNKNLCRLKDIRDLFMDTGMGADAYSVIELKMVETILSDRADERRRLFEEAAGVTKYKHRRKEAYRRLESVQSDLTRVGDIVREVQKAVNSLERQAQKAERYNSLAKQLIELETGLLTREYASVVTKVAPLQEQLAMTVDEKNKIDVGLRQEETLLDVLRTEMEELEDRIAESVAVLTRQQEIVHQHEQALAMARERRKSLKGNIERYEREKVELMGQRQRLEERLAGLQASLEMLTLKVRSAEEAYAAKKKDLDAFDHQVNEKKTEVKGFQDRVISLLHEVGDLRQRENQAKARIENLRGRADFISEEGKSLQEEIRDNSDLVVTLTAEDRELRRKFAEAEVRVHEIEDARQARRSEIERLREKDFEIRSAMERKQAKLDFLKGLVESFDGVSEGARYLLGSEEWKSSVETTVGEALSVDPRYRVALETALGDSSGYVIVETDRIAYDAIEHLKKSRKGKATFVCLDRIPVSPNHRPPVSVEGITGWASDFVKADTRYQPLFRFLLEGTLVVRDVDAAREVVKRSPEVRCVTLDGEIVTGRGVVRGGSVRQDEGGNIGRRAQIGELFKEVEDLTQQRERLQVEVQRAAEVLNSADVKSLVEQAREIEQQTTTVEVRIAQLEFEKKRAAEAVERGRTETEKLVHEIESLKRELDSIVPALADLERSKTEAERSLGVATNELETMEALLNEYSRSAGDAHVAALSAKGEHRSVEQEIQHAHSTIHSLTTSFQQRISDIEAAKEELELLAEQGEKTESVLREARGQTHRLKEQKQAVLRLKNERLKHEGSLKVAHDLEFKIQELTMKADTLKSRAKDEFELELQLETFDDNEAFDFTAAREEVRTVKERLRSLGAVNFAAFDEYKSEKERLDFVNAQKSDLEESEKTLLATIEEINTTAQNKFLETFGLIRENFISTFKGLFDEGDECDLNLEEGVDPLEARIEITAKPRGKRPTSIDLLSGGEKTLTAIALLFAIYLVKPSPFCILDEVDAPLDDSNIDRFTRILQRFSDNTQFIVVTHNKRTMESANALYGVTMEEEGVSKLVSVRFDLPVPG